MKADVHRPSYGYECPNCHIGDVVPIVIAQFKTILHGKPVTIIDACIGECDRCSTRYFDPAEVKRWESEGVFV